MFRQWAMMHQSVRPGQGESAQTSWALIWSDPGTIAPRPHARAHGAAGLSANASSRAMTAPDAPTPAAPIDLPAPSSTTEAPAAAATPNLSPAECAERLRSLFPALFSGLARPVKLRIQADIQARAPGVFTKAALSAFLRRYTGSTSYLISLTRAPQRLDLDGQPAGEISDEHRQAASDELARRRTIHETRRQAEEDQRRERWQLLRAFETTTLTKDNFCALKGVTPDVLDATLAQARQEAEERARVRPPQPHGGRPDGRTGARPAPGAGARPEARRGGRDGRPSDARGPGERGPRPPRPAR